MIKFDNQIILTGGYIVDHRYYTSTFSGDFSAVEWTYTNGDLDRGHAKLETKRSEDNQTSMSNLAMSNLAMSSLDPQFFDSNQIISGMI